MAEKRTPQGLIVGIIPEEKPQEQPTQQEAAEKPVSTRGRKPKTENKD